MFNISSYLEKFRNLEPPGDSEKKALMKAVSETTGIKIERSAVNVSNGIVYLSVSPLVKNEIYMNKRNILKKIQEMLGENKIKDIR